MIAPTYAAAVTTTIRLGVSVMVLPMLHHLIDVAHKERTLDYLSNGRAILGAGRAGITTTRNEVLASAGSADPGKRESIKAPRTESEVSHHGDIYQLEGATMAPKPVEKPHPPIGSVGASGCAPPGRDHRRRWTGSAGPSRAALPVASETEAELEGPGVTRRRS